MSQKMNLIFEPEDLEVASPATVSRCGMIFLEPLRLGWRPILESYLNHDSILWLDTDNGEQQYMKLIKEMCEWLVDPCYHFITHTCKQFLSTSILHLFNSMINLFHCLLETWKRMGERSPQELSSILVQNLMLFSLVWSLGGTLNGDSQKRFDPFFRTLISGTNQQYPRPKKVKITKSNSFPERGVIFDYLYDLNATSTGQWAPWEDLIDRNSSTFPPNMKANEIIVETTQTAMQKFFLRTFTAHKVPLVFIGPTGEHILRHMLFRLRIYFATIIRNGEVSHLQPVLDESTQNLHS